MIRTVSESVASEKVALVLPHEHIFHRIHKQTPSSLPSSTAAINVEDLQEYRRDPWAHNGQNMVMEREDEAFRELELLTTAIEQEQQEAGITAMISKPLVVDVTVPMEGRDEFHAKRVQLSTQLGIHIIAVTTFELHQMDGFPVGLSATEQSERIANVLETELLFGFVATHASGSSVLSTSAVCAGAIYQQVHISSTQLSTKEQILAHGLALVQARTQAPVFLSFSIDTDSNGHPQPDVLQQMIVTWLDVLIQYGANRKKLVVCHADRWCGSSPAFLNKLLNLGVTILFNMIGLSTVSDITIINPCITKRQFAHEEEEEPPRDITIAKWISSVPSHQFSQILLSTNVQQRVQYQRYGGGGYTYLFRFLKQRLVRLGVTELKWEQLIRTNAVELLAWYTPPPPPEVPKHFLKCSICKKDFEPIEGEYFTKFEFVYCGTKCLRRHSRQQFAKLT